LSAANYLGAKSERSLIFIANACQVTSDKLHDPVSP